MSSRLRLGQALIAKGSLSMQQLREALHKQRQQGGKLGDILCAEGMLAPRMVQEAAAEQSHMPFWNLRNVQLDESLASLCGLEECLHFRALPVLLDRKAVLTVALCEESAELHDWVRMRFGNNVQLVMATPADIRMATERLFHNEIDDDIRFRLWKEAPILSARQTFNLLQVQALALIGLIAFAGWWLWPVQTLITIAVASQIFFLFSLNFKSWVFANAQRAPRYPTADALANLDESTLPYYTVLVPLYREPETVPHLLRSLERMDYPKAKLDVKLVMEADDLQTYRAAIALKPCYLFDIIRVPYSLPRTKPKACNYALRFARGEYITVFDSDDRPDPLQLKKAVATFRSLPDDVGCVQARLNYYNAGDNLLTRLFALEYAVLFHFMLPGLQKLGMPIPLGGTSNHLALHRLREVGEWDPFNVTEDADLGMRLSVIGLRTVMLDSLTLEEAPNSLYAWLRQRSRWIKGYMQTWLVCMRRPVFLYRTLGFRAFLGFQFMIGISCVVYITTPLLWLLAAAWCVSPYFPDLPPWLLVLALFNFAAGLAQNLQFAWKASKSGDVLKDGGLKPILAYPFYWILHSMAGYKALWQLLIRPHFWEKTIHGRAKTERTLLKT